MPFYDFWRRKQVTGFGQQLNRWVAEHAFAQIRAATPDLQRIVEIGPGRGDFADICMEHGLSYIAVDANIGLLRDMKTHDRLSAFVPPLPLHDMVADAVIASHVIEHAAGLPQATAMLNEMCRIVRPGGTVTIISPDLLWVRNYFWDCDYSHNFPISSRRLYQMFLDAGLDVVLMKYTYNHLTGWQGAIIGHLVRRLPYALFSAQPNSMLYSDRLYKLRLTFSRSVFIVGCRPATPS